MKQLLITLLVLVLFSTNASPKKVRSNEVSGLRNTEALYADNVEPHERIEKELWKANLDASLETFYHYSMPTKWRVVNSHFGYRPRFKRNHMGVDLKAHTGDTVMAVFSGVVKSTVHGGGGYGNYIILEHDSGVTTLYAHLSKILVKEGEIVENGEIIALSGNTGRSTGPHLHLEIRIDGKAIDPETVFDFRRGCLTDTEWMNSINR